MSRDPLRERDLRNPESILDRIIEQDAREAAAAEPHDDAIEMAGVVPLRRRRWPYAVAAASLAAVIGVASWALTGSGALTAEPLGDTTPTPTATATPVPGADESALPTPTPEPTRTPAPRPSRTPSPTSTTSAVPTPTTTATTAPTQDAPTAPAPLPSQELRPPSVRIVSAAVDGDRVVVTYRACAGSASAETFGPSLWVFDGPEQITYGRYGQLAAGECVTDTTSALKGTDPVRGRLTVRFAQPADSPEAAAGLNSDYSDDFEA